MELHFLRSLWPRSNRPLGGRYNLIQALGAGGFGHTFLAQDLHLPGQPICVIKQLKPHVDSGQALQVARRLFDTEASVLYELGTHPQIPQLLAHFEDNNEFYLAQEWVQGHSLTEEFNARQTDIQVVAFLVDVLSALAVVHQHRVIHRDLKPSNLIRRQHDQRIVLIDFGAVKQANIPLIPAGMELESRLDSGLDSGLDSALSHTISIGTQGYMPNEQIAGRPQFSSDIYAVGMMGIQLLTGRHPRTLIPDPVTGELDWQHYVPHTHPELIRVLNQMVFYDFRARYATATDALSALQSLPHELTQNQADGFSVPTPSSSPFPLSSNSTLVGATVDTQVRNTSKTRIDPPLVEGELGGVRHRIPERFGPTELASQNVRVRSLPRSHTRFMSGSVVLGTLGLGLMLGRVSPSPTPFASSMAQSLPEIPLTEDILEASVPEASVPEASVPEASVPEAISKVSVPEAVPEASVPETSLPENPREGIDGNVLSSFAHSTQISPQSGLSAPVPSPQPFEPVPAERLAPSSFQLNINPNPIPDLELSGDMNDDDLRSRRLSHASTPVHAQDSIQTPIQDPIQVHAQDPIQTPIQTPIQDQSQESYQVLTQPQSQEPTQGESQEPAQVQESWVALRENSGVQVRSGEDPDTPLGAIAPLLDPLWQAENLRNADRHTEALIQYDAAIAQVPESVDARVGQCFSLNSLHRYDDAMEACDQAIALDPTVSIAWSNRGAALWGLREVHLALASVEQSLVLDPNNTDAIQLQQVISEGLDP